MHLESQNFMPHYVNSYFFLYEMQKGSQHICVESPGVHEVRFVNSCVFFGNPVIKIDTTSPEVSICRVFLFFF